MSKKNGEDAAMNDDNSTLAERNDNDTTWSGPNDQVTTLAELKKWIQAFCEERDWDPYHGPKDLAIGLVTESAELLEIFRFIDSKRADEMLRDPVAREHMADELADSLYFIVRFAQMFDFDLATTVQRKLKKNAVKYPVG